MLYLLFRPQIQTLSLYNDIEVSGPKSRVDLLRIHYDSIFQILKEMQSIHLVIQALMHIIIPPNLYRESPMQQALHGGTEDSIPRISWSGPHLEPENMETFGLILCPC